MANAIAKPQFFVKVLLVIAMISGGLLLFPLVVGYGFAFGGYIPYGVVCKQNDDLFSGKIKAENYITFLMNRGCDFDAEVKRIFLDPKVLLPSVVPDRVLGILQKRITATTSDEVLAAGIVFNEIRTFRWPKEMNGCSPDDYCPQDAWGKDPVSKLFNFLETSYASYFAPVLSTAILNGATLLISVCDYGPIFCAALSLAYAGFLSLIGILVAKFFGWLGKAIVEAA